VSDEAGNIVVTFAGIDCAATLRVWPSPLAEVLTAVPPLVTVKVSVVGETTASVPVRFD
jgi:hypothetical protein